MVRFAEVQYYVSILAEENIPQHHALVPLYGLPNADLLESSFHTLRACKCRDQNNLMVIPLPSIITVVLIQPLPQLVNDWWRDCGMLLRSLVLMTWIEIFSMMERVWYNLQMRMLCYIVLCSWYLKYMQIAAVYNTLHLVMSHLLPSYKPIWTALIIGSPPWTDQPSWTLSSTS